MAGRIGGGDRASASRAAGRSASRVSAATSSQCAIRSAKQFAPDADPALLVAVIGSVLARQAPHHPDEARARSPNSHISRRSLGSVPQDHGRRDRCSSGARRASCTIRRSLQPRARGPRVENTSCDERSDDRSQPGALIGTVLSGRYRLESKLGSGGMSTVYLARDETLERWVAVKVMHREISDQPDQIERFRREARAVAQLSHPNVVAVIDAGEDGGHPYIVFEYVDGETLKQRIDRARAAAARRGRRLRDRDRPRARRRPRAAARPPRRQAAERPHRLRGPGQGDRLRDRPLARAGRADQDRPRARHHRLRLARAGDGPAASTPAPTSTRSASCSTRCSPARSRSQADTLVGVAMKHVNEQMPDVQERRPEVSSALAAVVERATEKEPDEALPGHERDARRPRERARGRGRARGRLDTARRPPCSTRCPRRAAARHRAAGLDGRRSCSCSRRRRRRSLIAGADAASDEQRGSGGGGGAPPGGAEVELTGAQDFDPEGGDGEHPDEVELAIDGIPNTTWTTETYTAGPDLSLSRQARRRADRRGRPSRSTGQSITVGTTHGGWTPTVYAADSGPPTDLAGWGEPIGSIDRRRPTRSRSTSPPTGAGALLPDLDHQARRRRPTGGYSVEIDDVELLELAAEALELVARARASWRSSAEPHEPVAELRVGDAARLEQLREHAGLGEPGDRVDLVDQHLAVVADEEVAAGEAGAADRARRPARRARGRGRSPSSPIGAGTTSSMPPVGVLGLVVVPVGVGDDLARQRGLAARRCRSPSTRPRGRRRAPRRSPAGRGARASSTASSSSALGAGDLARSRRSSRAARASPRAAAPIAAACSRQPSSPASQKSTCGMPWKASRRLKISLSIATAAASTLGADVGDVEALEQALDRAVLAERAVQDRKGDVGSRAGRPPARSSTSSPSRGPAAVALDQDLDHLVARPSRRPSATEAPERSETSCSLERPPLSTATLIRASWWSWSSSTSWSWSWSSVGSVNLPTTIVTELAAAQRACRRSAPGRAPAVLARGRRSSCSTTVDAEPARSQARAGRVLATRRRRSGTITVPAPFETTIVTVVCRFARCVPAAGSWSITCPSGSSESRVLDVRRSSPRRGAASRRRPAAEPTTSGT